MLPSDMMKQSTSPNLHSNSSEVNKKLSFKDCWAEDDMCHKCRVYTIRSMLIKKKKLNCVQPCQLIIICDGLLVCDHHHSFSHRDP